MLIIRKNQVNNLIATVSMNKTLPNPYYLFSFQHIASKERTSFYPQVITSNVRYDKFRFTEAPTTNLSVVPPQVHFDYLGQYYYSIYENVSSASTDPSLSYNKLESGRAWVIVGEDNTQECFFEPYISNDEDFAQLIYVSEEEQECQQPFITPTNTPTPSITPSNTATPTITPSTTPTITPTATNNAICNSSITLSGWTNPSFDGVYEYNQIGYWGCCFGIFSGAVGSQSYIVYKKSGINQYIAWSTHIPNATWVLTEGLTTASALTTNTLTIGGLNYPQAGTTTSGAYLSYPSVCPTLTPTTTPTNTPTPSTTPPTVITPNTLNAIWWLDYSNSANMSLTFPNSILGSKNLTPYPDFSGKTGQLPVYYPLGYNGVSGATSTENNGLFSLSGDYGSVSAYTHFFHFKGSDTSSGNIAQSDGNQDYSGNTQPYRWFSADDFTSFPGNNTLRTYTFYTDGSSVNPEPEYSYSANTWTQGAIRVFQTTNTAHTEIWINGVLVDSQNDNGKTIITATTPIFKLLGNGTNELLITEQFFFDYKLDDTQMGTMFNYLNNKY